MPQTGTTRAEANIIDFRNKKHNNEHNKIEITRKHADQSNCVLPKEKKGERQKKHELITNTEKLICIQYISSLVLMGFE